MSFLPDKKFFDKLIYLFFFSRLCYRQNMFKNRKNRPALMTLPPDTLCHQQLGLRS